MDKPYTTICYRLANGRMVNIDVSISVKAAIEQAVRDERTQQRQEIRYGVNPYSTDYLDAMIAGAQKDIVDLLIESDERRRLKAAIAGLPVKQRRRLVLRFMHGLTYQQIADIEKVNANSIGKTIKKALLHLQSTIRE